MQTLGLGQQLAGLLDHLRRRFAVEGDALAVRTQLFSVGEAARTDDLIRFDLRLVKIVGGHKADFERGDKQVIDFFKREQRTITGDDIPAHFESMAAQRAQHKPGGSPIYVVDQIEAVAQRAGCILKHQNALVGHAGKKAHRFAAAPLRPALEGAERQTPRRLCHLGGGGGVERNAVCIAGKAASRAQKAAAMLMAPADSRRKRHDRFTRFE